MSSSSEKSNRIIRFFNSAKKPEGIISSIKNKSSNMITDERFPIEARLH